ncbi:MAG: hypothetical protein JNK46_00430 [Methylobacteriaceae bacterium]|nr:hypothetical protein [Methylobacteriaceae bacterium]
MGDPKSPVGKWLVKLKGWTWEYELFADSKAKWRDRNSAEGGEGRWAKSQGRIFITWFGSKTIESWAWPPAKPDVAMGWYSSDYFTGGYSAARVPDAPPPPPPGIEVNLGVRDQPWSKYVDQFTECVYDMNYKFPKDRPFPYSSILQLKYADDVTLEIDFESELSDRVTTSAEALDAMAKATIGRAGRIFPTALTPRTTPRLFAARADALAMQEEDANLFMSVAVAGVAFVLSVPAMPAGAAPVSNVKIGRTRVPGVARAAAPVLSEAEQAAIAAIRQNPNFAKLTVQEVAAIRSYSGEGWAKINMFLRNGGGDAATRAEAEALIAGLKKLPGYSGKLTRSESIAIEEAVKRYPKGGVFKPEGMLSTSRGGAVAQREGNIAISITAVGKNGKDITQAAVHGASGGSKELEILFPPGTQFQIEEATQVGNALVVRLKEL